MASSGAPSNHAEAGEAAAVFPRYGAKPLHELPKREDQVVSAKKTYHLYRKEFLRSRCRLRNSLPARDQIPRPSLDGPNRISAGLPGGSVGHRTAGTYSERRGRVSREGLA